MYLVEACPVPTPADAERLVAGLWQLTAGRAIGLFTFGTGERVVLGVTAAHSGVEEAAASAIAEQCGGSVEPGWTIPAALEVAQEVAAVNLIPTERHLHLESRTFGWQRTDPLRGTFLALAGAPGGTVAGVALSLRALPDLHFALSLGAFAAGPSAGGLVARVSASFGGIGVRLRRPLLQRRAAQRMVRGGLRRPASVHRAEVVALFWHPPYGSDGALANRREDGLSPAGFLTAGPGA